MGRPARSRRPGGGVAGAALRTVGARVGVAAAVCALGVGAWAWRERHSGGAEVAGRPAEIAVAPARPAPRLAPPPVAGASTEADSGEPAHRDPSLPKADSSPPKAMSSALRSAFDAWLLASYAKCWKAPKTLPDGDPYLPKVRVSFKEDGELAAPPKLVNPPSDPAWRAHADAAIKAVKGCDPLHVPDKYADYYPAWKSRTVYFDPGRN